MQVSPAAVGEIVQVGVAHVELPLADRWTCVPNANFALQFGNDVPQRMPAGSLAAVTLPVPPAPVTVSVKGREALGATEHDPQ